MIEAQRLQKLANGSRQLEQLRNAYNKKSTTIHLKEMVGGALSFYAASLIAEVGGVHIFVAEDRDSAAYLMNDLYGMLDEKRVFFFPTSYKRSASYGTQDAQGVVQRTAAMSAISNHNAGYTIVCTYPQALSERVVAAEKLKRDTVGIAVGQKISMQVLEQALVDMEFERVDFVYEPGQYSMRGGIIDVFSFSESKPYRVDFFGDDVDSIRRFNISTQLSYEKMQSVEIVPNLSSKLSEQRYVSLAEFAGEQCSWWFHDADYVLRKVNDIRRKLLTEMEDPTKIDNYTTSRNSLLRDMESSRMFVLRDTVKERQVEQIVEFQTSPQPKFNKNFEMLSDDIADNKIRGYKTYILSENKIQIERLENIFHQIGRRETQIEPIRVTLHRGFVDHSLKICLYTDHEIFDRYQRYRINGEIKRDEQMTVAELNRLKVGDYVVHIDHGVGRFDGLIKLNEGGKIKEAIKLVYKDGDVLFVNIHALHKISRYKAGDGEPPKVYKLGTGAWQKLKNAAKKAVKDISRELIALYAKRKASTGFAFSRDGYLQHELEASFPWEETPDQHSTVEAIKRDMESERPMDRLVCGDVGFGKTEVAIRAAFKAATDGKQVAILVPTTILAMQHFRSFSSRLRDFPIQVEYLNRTKSTKEVNRIIDELASGKIDILIGTHKILGKRIEFKDLGLMVIDEEQKFGVAAKEKLKHLSVNVDMLTLTATPIPRTLQFSLMGSRDLSVISTPPANRRPIVTESHLFTDEVIRDSVEAELSRGGQVYFVHNKVDSLPQIKAKVEKLCPKARVCIGHGRMAPKDLEKLIVDFIYGEFDVLVATTIIESGIDIPNANTIIINNAHNFGLSDLHQMRGRVGRSDRKAYCYLLSPPDELLSSDARRRLRAIEEFSDLGSGFNIAMQDLDIRGAGNLLGSEQSGFVADVGFEAYQKILNEAISELRAEGLDVQGFSNEEQEVVDQMRFIDDATIDIDVEANLPDNYVGQQAEKLRLYRELDSIKDEEALVGFEERLVDRFGALPKPAQELLNVVRLRWEAIRLGMERVKVKNGLMIVHFVGEQNSPYYKTEIFMDLLKKVTAQPDRYVIRQQNNRLAMTIRRVEGIEDGYKILKQL